MFFKPMRSCERLFRFYKKENTPKDFWPNFDLY